MAQEISLDRYNGCILYAGELGMGRSLVERKKVGDSEIEVDVPASKPDKMLNRVIPEYAKNGYVIAHGIAGRLFGEKQVGEYKLLKTNLDNCSDLIVSAADKRNKKTFYECVRAITANENRMNELLSIPESKEIAQTMIEYAKLVEGAISLANDRYNDIGGALINQDRVLTVKGVNDTSWPLVKSEGVCLDWLNDPKFVVAYFGGCNYNTDDPLELDAPEDMRKTEDEDLRNFLRKNEFDLLAFSGSYNFLKEAIEDVNKERLESTKRRFGFGKKTSGLIRNRVFIVNDPYVEKPEQYIMKDLDNVFVSGLNFGRDRTLLLVDYYNRALNVLKLRREASEGLNDSFAVLESRVCGRDGILGDWDIQKSSEELRRRASREAAELAAGRMFTTSIAARMYSVVSDLKLKKGSLVRTLLPYLASFAAGTGVTYLAMRSGRLEDAVQKYVSEMKTKNIELEKRDNILQGLRKDINEYQKLLEEATR